MTADLEQGAAGSRPDDAVAAPGAAVAAWRRSWRRTPPPAVPVLADGMLKLMLILLAFFVFLHSRSEISERKVAPILDSLALRFAATASADDPALATLALGADPAAELRRRLFGHLPISAAAVAVPGALVAFDLDEAALFEPGGQAVRRERLVLLHRVAAALAGAAKAPAPLLTVTTAWPDAAGEPVVGRMAALAAIFADTPQAESRLRLGFADLPAGRWRFVIRAGPRDAA